MSHSSLSFLHRVILVFQKPLLLLQMTNALFPELTEITESFRCKILQRQSSEFFGPTTAELLRKVDEEQANVLKSSLKGFYTITLEYISKWYRFEKNPKYINWTMLRDKKIEHEEGSWQNKMVH